jgi:hypothetical protein
MDERKWRPTKRLPWRAGDPISFDISILLACKPESRSRRLA